MPSNVTTIAGATPLDFYLGNYSYADFDAEGVSAKLRFKLDTVTHRLMWKNAAGTTVKAMADASTTANHGSARVLFTDALGAADASAALKYDGNALGLGMSGFRGWPSGKGIIQLGDENGFYADDDTELSVLFNAYYDDTDSRYEYASTGAVARHKLGPALHALQVAASGTADTEITWLDILELDAATAGWPIHFRKGQSGATASASADTMVMEAAGTGLDFELSMLAGDGRDIRHYLGDTTDPDYFQHLYSRTNQKHTYKMGSWNAFTWEEDTRYAGVGVSNPLAHWHVYHNSSDTTAIREFIRMTHDAQYPGDGFGVRITGVLNNQTQATQYTAGAIDILWADENAGHADQVFHTTNAWSLEETLRLIGQENGAQLLSTGALYFGEHATNGTWRIVRSGNDLVIQRRETGSYVTKSTISA